MMSKTNKITEKIVRKYAEKLKLDSWSNAVS